MSYDNSELLNSYVQAYQATGNQFFADVAHGIIRWMDEWLSDRRHGGFYASQDADYSMEDDGDYFTWTVEEAKGVLTEEEARVACLHYDINEIGEMEHNPAKNVLYQRASVEEIAARLKFPPERISELLESAKSKMYAARLKRPTPYVDKTIYVSWNALCVSAYLKAAAVLGMDEARRFALRSLDRVLAEAWNPQSGLKHVVAYPDGAALRHTQGFLDDYASTANACLDAYEATADLTYFRKARQIADLMIEKLYDVGGGGFFDSAPERDSLGVLGTPRKPFQDSPTPAGNPMAAIALLRIHGYTGEAGYRRKADQTLGLLASSAGSYGLFAATYGIAALYAAYPHEQVVIVGVDDTAFDHCREAALSTKFGRSVIRLTPSQAVAQNLPPALAATIPELPGVKAGKTTAVVCSGFTCQPPVSSRQELQKVLGARPSAR
jgi:uncharacterized protein YyaL (SSP411 family)